MNGIYYQVTTDASNTSSLWASDGTPAGTRVLKTFPGTGSAAAPPVLMAGLGRIEFFGAAGQLWRTDGTPDGTYAVAPARSVGSSVAVNNVVYFAESDPATGVELWRTDGSAAGTRIVKDLNPGAGDGLLSNPSVAYGTIYFGGTDGTSGGAVVEERRDRRRHRDGQELRRRRVGHPPDRRGRNFLPHHPRLRQRVQPVEDRRDLGGNGPREGLHPRGRLDGRQPVRLLLHGHARPTVLRHVRRRVLGDRRQRRRDRQPGHRGQRRLRRDLRRRRGLLLDRARAALEERRHGRRDPEGRRRPGHPAAHAVRRRALLLRQ